MQMASTVFAPQPRIPLSQGALPGTPSTYAPAPAAAGAGIPAGATPLPRPNGTLPQPQKYPALPLHSSAARSSGKLVWWVLVVGAGVGTAMALLFSK
jgi:hypothetical protein